MKPNLIVIGAAKCGTTSLHRYLDEHPEIAMSRVKELNFFVAEKNGGRDLSWYERQFDAEAPVRGETTPAYAAHPVYRGVPERMQAVLPDAMLVYLVRDPIERIVSHYLHNLAAHPDQETPFAEALATPRGRSWIALSRYWLQLGRYLEHFPEEQILVVDSDELRHRRLEALRRIFRFLGVDPEFRSAAFEEVHIPGPPPSRRTRAGRAVVTGLSRSLGRERAEALVARAPAALRAPFRRRVERPQLSGELRERLAGELRDEVQELRRHTGLAFAGWSL